MTLIVASHAIVRSFLSPSDPCATSNLGQLTENAIPNVAQARYLGQCNKLPSGQRSTHSKENSTTGESVVSRPSIPVPSSPTMKTLKLIRSDAIVPARLIVRAMTSLDRVVVLSTGAYIVRLAHSGSFLHVTSLIASVESGPTTNGRRHRNLDNYLLQITRKLQLFFVFSSRRRANTTHILRGG
jgi:hypothetical protein